MQRVVENELKTRREAPIFGVMASGANMIKLNIRPGEPLMGVGAFNQPLTKPELNPNST